MRKERLATKNTLQAFVEQKRAELQELAKKIARIYSYRHIKDIVRVYYDRTNFVVNARGFATFSLEFVIGGWLMDYEESLREYGIENIFPLRLACQVVSVEERGTDWINEHGEVIVFWVAWQKPSTISEIKEKLYYSGYEDWATTDIYPVWLTTDKVLDMLGELGLSPIESETMRFFFSRLAGFLDARDKKLFLCVDVNSVDGKYRFDYKLCIR